MLAPVDDDTLMAAFTHLHRHLNFFPSNGSSPHGRIIPHSSIALRRAGSYNFCMKHFRAVCLFTLATLIAIFIPSALGAKQNAQTELTPRVFLPLVTSAACQDIAGETYQTLVPISLPTDRPAEQHADLNLALRGYVATTHTLGLVDYGGATDSRAPKLFSLFADNRVPEFSSVSHVYAWDWLTNSRGEPITNPPVTLAGMRVTPDEILRVPKSEYNIGTRTLRPTRGFFIDAPKDDPTKFEVLVLYASHERITLKYTREDNVILGYTLHIENVCVASALLDLYRSWNQNGRGQLPGLKQGQAFGRARANTIGVVIRDNGSFMDPRSKKDWW